MDPLECGGKQVKKEKNSHRTKKMSKKKVFIFEGKKRLRTNLSHTLRGEGYGVKIVYYGHREKNSKFCDRKSNINVSLMLYTIIFHLGVKKWILLPRTGQ